MNQRQKTGRAPGSADVPIVLVTQRQIIPVGPGCAGCSENDEHGFELRQHRRTAATSIDVHKFVHAEDCLAQIGQCNLLGATASGAAILCRLAGKESFRKFSLIE